MGWGAENTHWWNQGRDRAWLQPIILWVTKLTPWWPLYYSTGLRNGVRRPGYYSAFTGVRLHHSQNVGKVWVQRHTGTTASAKAEQGPMMLGPVQTQSKTVTPVKTHVTSLFNCLASWWPTVLGEEKLFLAYRFLFYSTWNWLFGKVQLCRVCTELMLDGA